MRDYGFRTGCLSLGLALAGCVTPIDRADQAWRRGDVAAATSGYERVLIEGAPEEARDRALLRLAVALIRPDATPAERARARELLLELTRSSAAGGSRREAEAVLALLDREQTTAAKLATVEREREQLAAELERLRTDVSVKETTLARLRANLSEAEAEAARLRRALEQLKRIDLDRRP